MSVDMKDYLAYQEGYEAGKRDAAPRWVRCEDELPKEDGDYLTYYIGGYCAVNHWSKGWGWMYDEEAVRYWMPIEPPKEDEHGNK